MKTTKLFIQFLPGFFALIVSLCLGYQLLGFCESNYLKLAQEKKALEIHVLKLENIKRYWISSCHNHRLLKEKGWEESKNRKFAIQKIKDVYKANQPLNVSLLFQPEKLKHNIPVSSMDVFIKISSPHDQIIYAFIKSLLEQYPGVIIPKSFILKRNEHPQALLKQMEDASIPHFIGGEFKFEWLSRDIRNGN